MPSSVSPAWPHGGRAVVPGAAGMWRSQPQVRALPGARDPHETDWPFWLDALEVLFLCRTVGTDDVAESP